MVLIEYIPFGDLLGYLRKSRGLNDTYYKDPDVKPQSTLTAEQLIKFAWQVADGCVIWLLERLALSCVHPIRTRAFLDITLFCSYKNNISTFRHCGETKVF